jgi:hypothetical protein
MLGIMITSTRAKDPRSAPAALPHLFYQTLPSQRSTVEAV